jgi:hypothetical protein
MKSDLPLYMSDDTRRLTFTCLQMLDDGTTYDDEDNPEDVEIQVEDYGRVPEYVKIRADLALAQLVDVQVEADATSQATTITQLDQVTKLGGGVHLTRLKPEKSGSTPVRRGGLLFSGGGNEDNSMEWKMPSMRRIMGCLGQGDCLCYVLMTMTMRLVTTMAETGRNYQRTGLQHCLWLDLVQLSPVLRLEHVPEM